MEILHFVQDVRGMVQDDKRMVQDVRGMIQGDKGMVQDVRVMIQGDKGAFRTREGWFGSRVKICVSNSNERRLWQIRQPEAI